MKLFKSLFTLTKFEIFLAITSVIVILISSILSSSTPLNTSASLIGVIALIYVAKGLPIGQLLTIIFSLLYSICSFKFKYYGELATYAFMSLPAALITFIIWLKHPFNNVSTEIKIENLNYIKVILSIIISISVTIIFYFILKYLNTPNLIVSTISVFTSMLACSFLILRSPLYAIFYSLNDIVLIILWTLATITNLIYLNLVLCFIIFFINDLYGYVNWIKMKRNQNITKIE